MTETEIYQAAIDKWGKEHQIDKAIEECGELIAALIQCRDDRIADIDVLGEIGDVYVTLGQLSLIYAVPGRTYDPKKIKLEKLEKLIAEE
jgi:hypothetical protein